MTSCSSRKRSRSSTVRSNSARWLASDRGRTRRRSSRCRPARRRWPSGRSRPAGRSRPRAAPGRGRGRGRRAAGCTAREVVAAHRHDRSCACTFCLQLVRSSLGRSRPLMLRSGASPPPGIGDPCDDQDRLRRDARAVPSDRPARLLRRGRGRRLRRRVHGQRALPSVDAAAGPERLRLVVHGGARDADDAAVRDRRDLPRLPLPPGGDRPRGGDARGDVPGPVLARASAPARRSTSTSSAASGPRRTSAAR